MPEALSYLCEGLGLSDSQPFPQKGELTLKPETQQTNDLFKNMSALASFSRNYVASARTLKQSSLSLELTKLKAFDLNHTTLNPHTLNAPAAFASDA